MRFSLPGRQFQLTCLLTSGFLFGALWCTAQQPASDDPNKDYSAELPRIAPHEPAEAMATFQVQPGYELQQVAAEPLVASPVAISFDENGRLYVVEMRDYSEQETERLGTIRLLEDTDEDGRFDKSTVFLDDLSWPTAVICYDGGVFVGAAPDLLFAKDTDGDGRADVRRVVLTGFERTNVQGLMNTLQWGLDHRIHGATSGSGASLRPGDDPKARPVVLRGRDFAFDPRTLKVESTSGGAQHGMSFDDWGRKFVCSNSDHLQMVMFEDRYLARNPYLVAPSARISIAADGPQAEVFRISPVEPWRIVRTRLRVSGVVRGPIEGGGRAAGYFTGATGATIYRGDAWPEENRGLAIIGDVGSNIIHRKRLEPDGVALIGRRVDEKSEFVSSTDIWFRPAQFANAPDGTLYVVDVYREVIEHPKSLPEMIKKHLDLTSGRDRGRIYRIVPAGFKQPKLPRLGSATTAELVALLEHPNGWHRDTAGRLLYQRQDRSAVEPLRRLAVQSKSPLGRMHALYGLDALGALDAERVLRALSDEHPRIREHAVRLSERVLAASADVRRRLYALVDDDDLRVRYQLAFTLGDVSEGQRTEALARLAERDGGNSWVRPAILSSLSTGAGEVLARLVADETYRQSEAGRSMLESLAAQVGAHQQKDEVARLLSVIQNLPPEESLLAQSLVRGFGSGVSRAGGQLRDVLASVAGGRAEELLTGLLRDARRIAIDANRRATARAEAIRTLGLARFEDVRDVLTPLLDSRQPQEVQLATLATLARFDDPQVAAILLSDWSGYGPRLRTEATEVMFARPKWLGALLDAIEQSQVSPGDIDPARVKQLLSHSNKGLRERAGKLFSEVKLGRRQDVVDAYRGVLQLTGDSLRGKETFKKSCAACHRLEGEGHEIGPNLATIQNRGAESILLNVLDPNREVNPQYVNYILVTNEGLSMTGMIAAESATSITLRRAENASDTVLRVNIEELQSTGMSLMPEGMEKQLDQQAVADLIAYLNTVK